MVQKCKTLAPTFLFLFQIIFATCALALTAAQQQFTGDSKHAKILKEQRFNAGDGRAGAAFATEDGHIFKEETDVNGNRIGQYSYIGDDGQTYTVKYSAGIDGFRILSGDHVPSTGRDAAAFGAEDYVDEAAPIAAPAVQQQQRFHPRQEVRQAAPAPQPQFNDYDDVPSDPNRNPFINPHDPTHRNFQFNKHAAKFAPESPAARAASLVPACADCEGLNPFINPFDPSHQAGQVGHFAGQQQAPRAQAPARAALPQRPSTKQAAQALPQFLRETTDAPVRNFFPPGKLQLNRFETGFNFDFQS
jgi:hypothetical protein